MFKVPDWEADIPKTNINFVENVKKKQAAVVGKVQSMKKTVKRKQTKIKSSVSNGDKTAKKRKQDDRIINTKKKKQNETYDFEPQLYDTDKPSEVKKNKLNDKLKSEDIEDVLFKEQKKNKSKRKLKNVKTELLIKNNVEKSYVDKKKDKIKQILQISSNRNPINASSNKLRERMMERLKAAQFRYLNEKLYTSSGRDAQQLFQSDPVAFQVYHQGYQQQLKKWPVNPLDVIVSKIVKMPKSHLIADMGCGEAALSKRVPHKVRSFDLVANGPEVEVCDMAHTPLLAESMDVVVYCLALMGTDLTQYLIEANRVLKIGGYLLIAEVESRFDKVETFTNDVQRLGFKLKNVDENNKVFYFMEFLKVRDPPVKKSKLPALTLKPCLYKRR